MYVRQSRLLAAFICTLIAVSSCWILQDQLEGFAIWLLGCAVSLIVPIVNFGTRHKWLGVFIWCASIGFGLCLHYWHSDLYVGVSFALLLYGVLQIRKPMSAPFLRLAQTFAAFSYSLYVLHFPFLFLIRAAVFPRDRWQPDALHLLYASFLAAGVLVYAFVVSRATEANTPKLRLWLQNHVNGSVDSPGRAKERSNAKGL